MSNYSYISCCIPYPPPPPLLPVVPGPEDTCATAVATEVLEIAAGGGTKVGVASRGSDDVVEDYLQGDDSEIISVFSGEFHAPPSPPPPPIGMLMFSWLKV